MIIIRTKGNHKQGMGDIVGSLAIADALNNNNKSCKLAIDNDLEAIQELEKSLTPYIVFNNWEEEQEWWVNNKSNINAVIFNQLNSSEQKVSFIKQTSNSLIVTVDDVGPSAAISDLRFNPLYHYPDSYIGPKFIPLKNEFQQAHKLEKKYSSSIKNLLITLGGSDTYGFTPKILDLIKPLSKDIANTTVIIGNAYQHYSELEQITGSWESSLKILTYIPPEEMVKQMHKADIAICSGGLTLFEMACLGTPALVVSNELFELETVAEMEKLGYGISLGYGENIDSKTFIDKFNMLFNNFEYRQNMGINGKELVNGLGADTIARYIINHLHH